MGENPTDVEYAVEEKTVAKPGETRGKKETEASLFIDAMNALHDHGFRLAGRVTAGDGVFNTLTIQEHMKLAEWGCTNVSPVNVRNAGPVLSATYKVRDGAIDMAGDALDRFSAGEFEAGYQLLGLAEALKGRVNNAVKRGASALGFLSSSQWASVRTHVHGKICSHDLIVGGLARKRRKVICEGFNAVLKYCLRLLNRGRECWTAGEAHVKNKYN